eukprot:GCRY01003669.1.p1 GENE.GCRY01003669.1~~GCRY01003669.1.p1  ORF type:complete len:680 (-),score=141.67 GCRY01003669.1:52-1980(-)
MKFAKRLKHSMVEEWFTQYFDFKGLKKLIKQIHFQQVNADENSVQLAENKFENFFFSNVEKVNTFFNEHEARLMSTFEELNHQASYLHFHEHEKGKVNQFQSSVSSSQLNEIQLASINPVNGKVVPETLPKNKMRKAKHQLSEAFLEYYRGLELLHTYQVLNKTAIVKILKKHDKHCHMETAPDRLHAAEQKHFWGSAHLSSLKNQVEAIYARIFSFGNKKSAIKALRLDNFVASGGFSSVLFLAGVLLGFLVAVVPAVWSEAKSIDNDEIINGIRLYLGLYFPLVLVIGLAVNMRVWRLHRVNPVFIFELDPRGHLRSPHILLIGLALTVWMTLPLYIYVLAHTKGHDLSFPFLYLTGALPVLAWFAWPFHNCHATTRRTIWGSLRRMVIAPYKPVAFIDFFLADQLTSLSFFFKCIPAVLCVVFSSDAWHLGSTEHCRTGETVKLLGILVATWPFLSRFLQCYRKYKDTKLAFPHLVNLGKYSTTLFLNAASIVFLYNDTVLAESVVIALAAVKAVYSLFWDIRMDWGLAIKANGRRTFLRRVSLFPHWAYYVLVGLNSCFRFTWVLPHISDTLFDTPEVSLILAFVEVLRRFLWNFIRLENEQVSNLEGYRAIRDIPLPFDLRDCTSDVDDEDGDGKDD